MLSWLLYLLYLWGIWVLFISTYSRKLEGIHLFLFHYSLCHRQHNISSKILYSDPDVAGVLSFWSFKCTQKCPLNFNVKGMLQASGSLGDLWEGTQSSECVVWLWVCGLQGTFLLTGYISFVWLFSLSLQYVVCVQWFTYQLVCMLHRHSCRECMFKYSMCWWTMNIVFVSKRKAVFALF